jgi:hypothetical protein
MMVGMKTIAQIISIVGLFTVAGSGLVGCALEEPTDGGEQAPAEVKIDGVGTQQAPPPKVKLGDSWICFATGSTCANGNPEMFCHSGNERDGVFSCKAPDAT